MAENGNDEFTGGGRGPTRRDRLFGVMPTLLGRRSGQASGLAVSYDIRGACRTFYF